jgi:hypothetical protein
MKKLTIDKTHKYLFVIPAIAMIYLAGWLILHLLGPVYGIELTIFLVCAILYSFIYEGCHLIGYWIAKVKPADMKFAVSFPSVDLKCSKPLSYRQYFVGSLAPLLVVGIILPAVTILISPRLAIALFISGLSVSIRDISSNIDLINVWKRVVSISENKERNLEVTLK